MTALAALEAGMLALEAADPQTITIDFGLELWNVPIPANVSGMRRNRTPLDRGGWTYEYSGTILVRKTALTALPVSEGWPPRPQEGRTVTLHSFGNAKVKIESIDEDSVSFTLTIEGRKR
jgi:hypothetical protein